MAMHGKQPCTVYFSNLRNERSVDERENKREQCFCFSFIFWLYLRYSPVSHFLVLSPLCRPPEVVDHGNNKTTTTHTEEEEGLLIQLPTSLDSLEETEDTLPGDNRTSRQLQRRDATVRSSFPRHCLRFNFTEGDSMKRVVTRRISGVLQIVPTPLRENGWWDVTAELSLCGSM